MSTQLILQCLDGRSISIDVPIGCTVEYLKRRINAVEGVPVEDFRLRLDGIDCTDSTTLTSSLHFGAMLLRVVGGKGGFGSLLRGGPQGVRLRKVGHDACRDLATGKRIRQLNNEKLLQEWNALEKEREELKQLELEKKRKEKEESKPKFDDMKYSKEITEIREDVTAAVQEGIQAALMKEKEQKEKKRKLEQESKALHPPSKKHGLWNDLFDDLPLSGDEQSEEPAKPTKTHSKKVKGPAKKKQKSTLEHPTTSNNNSNNSIKPKQERTT